MVPVRRLLPNVVIGFYILITLLVSVYVVRLYFAYRDRMHLISAVVLISVIFFLSYSLRRSDDFKKNLVTVLLSVSGSIFLVEILVVFLPETRVKTAVSLA